MILGIINKTCNENPLVTDQNSIKDYSNHQKLGESTKRVMDAVTINLNHEMKKQKKDTRYMLLFDKIAVSERAKERIEQIIREDKAPNHHH